MDKRQTIVVAGGGFAGLNFVKHIDKKRFRVILVDRNNYHSFPPLFYQIASSGLTPDSICFPYRRELRKGKGRGAEFHLGEIRSVNLARRTVTTQFETINYDYIVIAAGSTNNFFGNDSLRDMVYTLKSTAQAMRCRDEILDRLERASLCHDPDERKRMLSFTVVGGGPAGVEIAGALGEMKRYILHRSYPSIPLDDVSITLIEGSDRLLGAMSEKSQRDALKYVGELLVEVRLGTVVKSYDGDEITLSDGSRRHCGMLIWTAGIKGVDLNLSPAVESGKGSRLIVDEYNRLPGFESSAFALGDIALMQCPDYAAGHPQLAQVAIQQGVTLASNLNRGTFTRKFVYRDKGTMATVGRNRAVADIGPSHLSGWIAWIAWMFIHLISLLGMRNKVNVLIDWMWGYFNYSTSLRLLLYPSRYPLKWRWGEN